MTRRAVRSALVLPLVLLAILIRVGAASGEITVQIGTVEAAPGAIVALPVTLHTNGEPISGFQTDLLFEPQVTPLGRGEQRADCSQNPALLPGELGLQSTLFEYDCASDGECIRATARLSSATFPSGPVVVYSCAVQVAHDAVPATYAVGCSNLGTSTQEGEPLPASCLDGAIVVAGEPVEVTPSVPPTPTPPATSEGTPVIEIANLSGHPGDRVTAEFRLRSNGASVSGVQADVAFPSAARIAARANGKPECVFGTDPNFAGYSGVAFLPPGCTADVCTAMRALLITSETVPISDGTLVMSCTVEIAADAATGVYAFVLSHLEASSPTGVAVPLDANPGTITVTDSAPSEPTDEAGQPATPTATPAAEPSANEGQQPVTGAAGAEMSSGCAVDPGHRSFGSSGFLLAITLFALRRRRK